mmetsp:Transcript_14257/g.56125  ORF Transcript_14257/g.56125 Transcript_14257/m.56125 type:complete len:290 (-) Transcript_14257:387-1256(-)
MELRPHEARDTNPELLSESANAFVVGAAWDDVGVLAERVQKGRPVHYSALYVLVRLQKLKQAPSCLFWHAKRRPVGNLQLEELHGSDCILDRAVAVSSCLDSSVQVGLNKNTESLLGRRASLVRIEQCRVCHPLVHDMQCPEIVLQRVTDEDGPRRHQLLQLGMDVLQPRLNWVQDGLRNATVLGDVVNHSSARLGVHVTHDLMVLVHNADTCQLRSLLSEHHLAVDCQHRPPFPRRKVLERDEVAVRKLVCPWKAVVEPLVRAERVVRQREHRLRLGARLLPPLLLLL